MNKWVAGVSGRGNTTLNTMRCLFLPSGAMLCKSQTVAMPDLWRQDAHPWLARCRKLKLVYKNSLAIKKLRRNLSCDLTIPPLYANKRVLKYFSTGRLSMNTHSCIVYSSQSGNDLSLHWAVGLKVQPVRAVKIL